LTHAAKMRSRVAELADFRFGNVTEAFFAISTCNDGSRRSPERPVEKAAALIRALPDSTTEFNPSPWEKD
jgi:hypothetical protein